MGLISKTDLYYSDYSWTVINGDNPKVTGEPDSTLLNRKEGYEILYFINKFCEMYKLKQKASATKVERTIRDEVPSDIRSQKNISDWLVKNWKTSKY
tara:strand:+ start:3285 stop:3575 length:291 start_codon:yes stop_codon:yes gene_type:complete